MNKYFKIVLCFSLFAFHFSLLCAQNDWVWAGYGKGNGLGNIGDNVTIDPNGNCVFTGYFLRGNITFGAETLTNNNTYDAFLAKYDQNGNLLWAKQSTGDNRGSTNGYVSSTDEAGNIYMTASFADTIILGPYLLKTSSQYSNSSVLVKYDPSGNVIWAKQSTVPTGDTSIAASNFIVTDKNGNSYITGLFADTAIFGNDSLCFGGKNANVFIVKYKANGNINWARESKGSSKMSGATAWGESLDKFGDIYLVGIFTDTISFGIDTLKGIYQNGSNNYDFFITKYDSNGNLKWAKQDKLPSISSEGYGEAVTCDQQGNAYVAGKFTDTMNLGLFQLITNSSNYTNIFIAKYDSSGQVVWAIQSKTPASYGASAWSISSDTTGHIYVCGGVGNKTPIFIIDNDTLKTTDTALYDDPAFLLKFDTAGHLLCGNIFPYSSLSFSGIASDPTGNYIYYASTLATEAIFGPDTIDPWTPQNNFFPIIARWKECDATLGVGNIVATTNNAEVKVYPNPSASQFNFAFNTPVNGTIEIYDITGREVSQFTINNSELKIDLSGQPAGMYFYRAITNTGSLIGEGKLIIQK